ncbi:MAG: PIN domain-containing protein [Coriobacteriia bacterium]
MQDAGITILPLTDEVVHEAAHQAEALGCSLFDALAPACAVLLGATLVSADARAHGRSRECASSVRRGFSLTTTQPLR